MRFLLMICGDGTEDVPDGMAAECAVWSAEMVRRGVLRHSVGLVRDGATAAVRVRDRQVVLGDGPFAESREWIGGFAEIECADLDAAVEIAAGHPLARHAVIEAREVVSVKAGPDRR